MTNTNPTTGLSSEEVSARIANGQVNTGKSSKTKRISQIFCSNIFTLFNLINIVLAVMVISVGSPRNALFLGVMICNTAIGILQEIRAKRAIDKLSIISEPKAEVIRNGERKIIASNELVIGDIMLLSSGMQICADGVVIDGECETNESLITGESDAIFKSAGAELYSGSFVSAGFVTAEVTGVGAESVSGKITSTHKYKKPSSEMMNAINRIIRLISFIIIPFGLIMLTKSIFVLKEPLDSSVTTAVAALIGMIPEGLVLLTSIALAVSAIRLSKRDVLCQDLYCVENLSRIDVLCLDKTGTLTEGRMNVFKVITTDKSFDIKGALSAFSAAFHEKNSTLKAISEYFGENSSEKAVKTIPFSSSRKFSAAQIEGRGTIVLGAAEFVCPDIPNELKPHYEKLAAKGYRMVILCQSPNPIENGTLPNNLIVKAVIALSDVIRPTAAKTLNYFKKQSVSTKIISGDAVSSVVNIAKQVNLPNADNAVDMSEISDELIPDICEKYSVFCRTKPEQKLLLIRALQTQGHKVAMTGDGVNDVLALCEADCSIAMQSGSDAARTVSKIVLMNSDFSSIPQVVYEGRRCINNIQHSASLFLSKTVFSVILTTIYLFLPLNYPLVPIQLTLISGLAIGVPSFLLAMEANKSRVEGNFISNVMAKSLPGGISAALGVSTLNILNIIFGFSSDEITTMAAVVTACAFFGVLWNTCKPFNLKRAIMFALLLATFSISAVVFHNVFYFVTLSEKCTIILVEVAAAVLICQMILRRLMSKCGNNS